MGLSARGAVELVEGDVGNEIVVAIEEHGVRLYFVDCVVGVEHGADGGAVDFFYQSVGFFEGLDDVGLAYRQRFNENGDAAIGRMRRHGDESFDVVARCLLGSESAWGRAPLWRATHHVPVT